MEDSEEDGRTDGAQHRLRESFHADIAASLLAKMFRGLNAER